MNQPLSVLGLTCKQYSQDVQFLIFMSTGIRDWTIRNCDLPPTSLDDDHKNVGEDG